MSLYTTGLEITIPYGTVVPGVVDPTIRKSEDVAIPGGEPINMQDYAANPTEPVLTQQQIGVQLHHKPLLKLGDSVHFDNDDPANKALIQPKSKSELKTIPSTTLVTEQRFDRY